jgi:septum formation protein
MIRVVLASASPARLATLERAGVRAEAVVSGVDESAVTASDAAALTARLAELKAEAVFSRLTAADAGAVHSATAEPAGAPGLIVIGCDSLLSFQGEAIGKPGTAAAAAVLWRRARGQTARLVTGHHVIAAEAAGVRRATRSAATVVRFADLSEAEIAAYVATGEPAAVAGGFTIDGLGGPFVTSLEGDPHNVVGLSLPLLRVMLADLGVAWSSLWSAAESLSSTRRPGRRPPGE